MILLMIPVFAYQEFVEVTPVEGFFEIGLIVVSAVVATLGGKQLLSATRIIADQKARTDAEVDFASKIQNDFLKPTSLDSGALQTYAVSQPAKKLGGDFFYLDEKHDKIIGIVGDVSGHGFGAGLLMVMLKSGLEHQFDHSSRPEEFISRLNSQLYSHSERSIFATLGGVIVDRLSGKGIVLNAGHMPLLHYQSEPGKLNEIKVPGVAMGMTRQIEPGIDEVTIEPNDWLILYSDGLVETRDSDGTVRETEHFYKLVEQYIREHSEKSPKELSGLILKQVIDQHHGSQFDDDCTLLLIKHSG